MKKIQIYIAILVLNSFPVLADVIDTDLFLHKLSQKIAASAEKLIPGEGTTEISIDLKDQKEPSYSILGVRTISESEAGNLFTQFSFSNTDVMILLILSVFKFQTISVKLNPK